jgi:diketogulonate reductase-like aldo/keto reductase
LQSELIKRTIPSTGEKLPVIGLGTWQTFNVTSEAEKVPLRAVLRNLATGGGKVIDSSPMYGRSEQIVGELSEETGLNDKFFMATKVWTSGKENGIRQMNQSLKLLRRKSIELMQIHNLTDWRTHLETLLSWREKGIFKYIGITHYTESAYAEMERILQHHQLDFVQVNYSILSRKAEERILPLAIDRNTAVIINRPFEEGALFSLVRGKPIPEWALGINCDSWGQLFLKFILAQPAVTCIIPGTANPTHLIDNLKAGVGTLPDNEMRKKLISIVQD